MDPRWWHHQAPTKHGWLWARPVLATSVPCPSAGPQRTMKVLLLTGLGALFFAYYWDDNFDPASLQGARVLLTGANAGVGEELAYHYARLGSHLVLTAHTEALLQKVVGNCRKLGAPKIFYIAADMASPEAPESVVQFALDKLGGLDYLVLNHIGGAPAGTRARSPQATRWLMQVNFLSYVQLTSRALPSLTDSKGSLVVVSSLLGACTRPRLCGTGSGELDAGEPGVSGQASRTRRSHSAAAVRAPRPRAHVVLHSLLGGQVRAGRLLRLPAAGAGRAGRERGHHHVRPGPPRSRLRRRGSQGSHEGQGGPGAQGSPGRDPRRRHARGRRLLPVAFPPVVFAPALAAAPAGLVYPPGAQRHGCGCSLSTRGCPSTSQTTAFLSPIVPGARTLTETPLRGWPQPKMKSSRQKSKTEKIDGHLEPITASEVQVPRVRRLCRGLARPHLFGHDG
ncbi:hydroxysteroid 11-beta-dehydrogenase 1-like protein isoform X2 [Nomascus leucogenys]|uniref:hydroxysteroid 11-beta-dehydrogenase 1-like protein isoform X2 n=1 Tax=Nomascus leucogenys TaxID=61853 RepID=UPI00122DABEB|nr:hydroxysteroid 11-beta-dehydrogenase 1-like protein isoform X2 [Nomascus leucogenys]